MLPRTCVTLLLLWLACASPCRSDDLPAVVGRPAAEALTKKGEHKLAMQIYDRLLAEGRPAPDLLADAARCALQLKQLRRAVGLAERALKEGGSTYRDSPAGVELTSFLQRAAAALAHRVQQSRRRAATFLERAIRQLPEHGAVARLDPLEPDPDEPPGTKWRLKDPLFEDGISGLVRIRAPKEVSVLLNESFDEAEAAEKRFEVIVGQIRAQTQNWAKRHRDATAQRPQDIEEMVVTYPEEAGARKSQVFCWDGSTKLTVVTSVIAQVDFLPPTPPTVDDAADPVGGGAPPAEPGPARWLLITTLSSSRLK